VRAVARPTTQPSREHRLFGRESSAPFAVQRSAEATGESRNVADVVIESDDEARRAAEAIIADVSSGELAAAEDFVSLYTDSRDAWRVWSYVQPMLNEAVKRQRG
jgi:hypothetical protein